MNIVKEGGGDWKNLHETYQQRITDLYDLANSTKGPNAIDNYNDATKGIQGIISDAIKNNTPLRPIGGNWSLSTITATSGIILNTKPLNSIFPISTKSLVNTAFVGDMTNLFLCQCGNGIFEISDFLQKRGKSLPASGASNGQTIAGAIATGTHGAGITFGAHQEAVIGLHIITGPGSSIWLERASVPAMADSFAALLNATPVRDDEAFNAAVVSFGAFGFVHGVMIQAEPIYLLEAYMRRITFDDALKHLVTTLDFQHPRLPYQGEVPYHFGTLLNPYDISNGAYMSVMYKRPYQQGYTPPKPNSEGVGPGDDAPCFIGKLSDVAPALVPALANAVIGKSLSLYEKQMGTLAQMFNNTLLRGKLASAAIGFPHDRAADVMDMLLRINKTSGPFVGVFAFRFVKSSIATMAFTRFAPVTAVLELDGVQSKGTMRFYDAVWAEMDKMGIPYTFHWGKMNTLTADKITNMYGGALTSFLQQRSKYVDAATLNILSNDTLQRWGIDDTQPGAASAPSSLIV
jgi:FAD/FMN-containing dehydrogenase